jgi:hypothetical protein
LLELPEAKQDKPILEKTVIDKNTIEKNAAEAKKEQSSSIQKVKPNAPH